MKIDITGENMLRVTEVFNSIVLETEDGEELIICMRDEAFEIAVKRKCDLLPKWYSASSKGIFPL